MSISQDEYEPSQIIADNSVSPHLQSFRRSRPSTSNLMQFFEAGGALDSQTTDSQHIQYLIKTREQASGESNEKRCRRCEHLQDNISNLKKELGAARERLKLNDENRSALHNALTRAMTTHREQLHERDQKIETLQTRLQEVIRLGFDIFADEFPGWSSCGSVSPPHGLGLSAMSSKSTSKEELREITEIWLTTNLVDPASTSGSSPLAKHNILKVDIDPQRRKVAEDTERDTTSEGGEVQIDKKMGQLDGKSQGDMSRTRPLESAALPMLSAQFSHIMFTQIQS
ncbi:hypothetical protein OF83DRAFT_1179724 [Amylostereum chailletii]|nr:hypothetical protein OF83DRAFT_1179724 [Amylostereum chailletii]